MHDITDPDSFRAGRLLVVGAAVLDRIYYVPQFPRPGETILSDRAEIHPGGKGCNQALAARLTGAEVKLITAVGSDDAAKEVIGPLHKAGVDITGVYEVPGMQTAQATIAVDEKGQNQIIVYSGAINHLTPAILEQNREAFAWADWLLLQNEIPRETTNEAMALGREYGCQIIVNPAPFTKESSRFPNGIEVLVPNEIEAAGMLGIDDYFELTVEDKASRWLEIKALNTIVTLGERGGEYFGRNGAWLPHKPWKVNTVDSIGAGDAYCGILAALLSEQVDPGHAAHIAHVGAALSTTRKGAQAGLPTRQNLAREWRLYMLENFQNQTDIFNNFNTMKLGK